MRAFILPFLLRAGLKEQAAFAVGFYLLLTAARQIISPSFIGGVFISNSLTAGVIGRVTRGATTLKSVVTERKNMERKYLEDLGIEKDTIDKIMAENGKDINAQKSLIEAETLKLTAANNTIAELQNAVKKFDGVDVEKLKTDVSTWEQKYNADVGKLKLEHALDTALLSNKAKNVKAVKALLDIEQIKLDGSKLLGLDEQIEKLRTEADYLFEPAQVEQPDPNETKVKTGGTHGSAGITDTDKLSDADYYAQYYKK